MKITIFIFIIILNFKSWTYADNVDEFEIEGMSIGDSLLSFYDKKFIDDNKEFGYDSTEMYSLYITSNLNTYEEIELNFRNYDNKYQILAIAGIKNIQINECLKKKEDITKEIKTLFSSDAQDYIYEYDNNYLTAGLDVTLTSLSQAHVTDWDLSNGDMVRVWCTEWGSDAKQKLNWKDQLRVKIQKADWMKFLKKQ